MSIKHQRIWNIEVQHYKSNTREESSDCSSLAYFADFSQRDSTSVYLSLNLINLRWSNLDSKDYKKIGIISHVSFCMKTKGEREWPQENSRSQTGSKDCKIISSSHWSNVISSLIGRNKVWFVRGSERLGAFAKPNTLNVECMRKRSNVVAHGEVHGEVHGVDHDRDLLAPLAVLL